MGLDISIQVNNNEQVYTRNYYDPEHNYFNKHNLSRTFCNLICRQNVIEGEPELDQIGRLTKVDISPIYAMETYCEPDNEELDFFLEMAETEEERVRLKQEAVQEAKESNEKLEGNIDLVLFTIDSLIKKLSNVDNLSRHLNDNGYDTLDNENYFSDFNIDKGEGYIGNNFGQDLRNFKRFLEYAKGKGTTTVYFNYG